MGEDKEFTPLYFRKKRNFFTELLYKFKILKPKYKELGKVENTKFFVEDKEK